MIDRNYTLEKRRAKEAREKEVRLQLIIVTLVITSIIFSLFIFISSQFDVHAAQAYQVDKIYTSYEVEEGDSLSLICSDYKQFGYLNMSDFYEEVCSINYLSSDDIIKTGEIIIIPKRVTNYS